MCGTLVLICADLSSGMFLLALGMWACPGWRRCTSSTPASPTPSISIPYLGTLRSSTPPFSGQRSVELEMLFRRVQLFTSSSCHSLSCYKPSSWQHPLIWQIYVQIVLERNCTTKCASGHVQVGVFPVHINRFCSGLYV